MTFQPLLPQTCPPSAGLAESNSALDPVLEIGFPITRGRALEVDHRHALYGALKRICSELKEISGLSIEVVDAGVGDGGNELKIYSATQVRLRLPASAVPILERLAGQELHVQGRPITLGQPQPWPLVAAPTLRARIVTMHFRNLQHEVARQQLLDRFLQAYPGTRPAVLAAHTLRIHGRQILGFAMVVRQLTAQASLSLLAGGFGGRRAFGCGIFRPLPVRAGLGGGGS